MSAAGGRGGRVVRVLAGTAGALVGVGDPEIGRAGVEVDDEWLLVGSDGDGASPFNVLLVGERLALALGEMLGQLSDILDVRSRVESSPATVSLEVKEVLAVLTGEAPQLLANIVECDLVKTTYLIVL